MKKANHIILGVHLQDRFKSAAEIQALFTEFGCLIKTRLGLHEVSDHYCSPAGLVLLELSGDARSATRFMRRLQKVDGVDVQRMVFAHN